MRIRKNIAGGEDVWLNSNDEFDGIPESHQEILTPQLRNVFRDPVSYFREIAGRTRLPNFARYLRDMTDHGDWLLLLADCYMPRRETVGAFLWKHPEHLWTLMAPTESQPPAGAFGELFDGIALLQWAEIGYKAGVLLPSNHTSLMEWGMECQNARFPAESTTVFGSSSCGDFLVHNSSGEAGWLSHETGQAYVIGSLHETLDWVANELCENREPSFDYSLLSDNDS